MSPQFGKFLKAFLSEAPASVSVALIEIVDNRIAGEELIDIATRVRANSNDLIVERCPTLVRLAQAFDAMPTEFKFRAIAERWGIEQLAQETCRAAATKKEN